MTFFTSFFIPVLGTEVADLHKIAIEELSKALG